MTPDRLRALDLARGLEATAGNLAKVGAVVGPSDAAWAFTQWRLRARARSKFSEADRMLFEAEALEQATHETVAAYHASRFPQATLVADLTTGIGGDLMALARRGPALGYDTDPSRAELAAHNAGLVRPTEVRVADALGAWSFDHAFADPARRTGGRRTLDPSMFAPDPLVLAARMREIRLGGLKLSPLLTDAYLASLGGELEFVSFGWECREALVWLGSGAGVGRCAIKVETGLRLDAAPSSRFADEPGAWFYEADPAAIRAHALGSVEQLGDLAQLGESNGYLTGDEPADSPWLRRYRVLETVAADARSVKERLRTYDARTPEVKTRAVKIDAETFRDRIKLAGKRDLALALYPAKGRTRCAILERS
ncbi:MAG: hypothetical protein KIS66_00775 [Fimbriimonadaceae bacterium]|nr:hypothetical protein [Fimbriimonadaceae bacterium]